MAQPHRARARGRVHARCAGARRRSTRKPTPSLLREVAEAVAAGIYGPWPPDFEVLHAVAEKVRDTAKSRLLVDDQQRRAQVDAAIGDALEARYAAPAAERTAARFEEYAYTAWKRGRAEEAERCIAAARCVPRTAGARQPRRARAARPRAATAARRAARRGSLLAAGEALDRVARAEPPLARHAARGSVRRRCSCSPICPAEFADLDGFEVEVPLARWNAVVRNAESDRKLLGGVLLDGATAKDRVARVVGSDPILCELQRVVRDATVALIEAGVLLIAPAMEEN